jgi:transcriptional regulator with XRE-family HTH domain
VGQEAHAAFGELLRGHRRARRLTQEALAGQAGLSPAGVSLMERGRVAPHFGTVSKLADALGLSLTERAALEAAAEDVDDGQDLRGAREAPAPRGGLTRKASSFVGRERELAEVRRRLVEHPLVTLTGPGGVGKTRLAVEAALGLAVVC